TPTRGIWQGDPLSPFLFVICVEVLSILIDQANREGLLHKIAICHRAPIISHLFFVDDSLIFARANLNECAQLTEILRLYERASGQKINFDKKKSKNVNISMRATVISCLGVRAVDQHGKYLSSVICARYFPRTDFTNATLGYNYSYSWFSLLTARDLLIRGLGWRIPNGASVPICSSWIPDGTRLSCLVPQSQVFGSVLVSTYIIDGVGGIHKQSVGILRLLMSGQFLAFLLLSLVAQILGCGGLIKMQISQSDHAIG
ncbi:hypothetical protein V2J09_010235, partial [Rumex salicifolius]